MQRLGRQVADAVAQHLGSLRDQRVLTNGLPVTTRRRLAEPPPDAPVPFDEILRELQTDVFPYSAREPHPRFMAYVPGSPTFPAVLGGWLATGYNFFAGVWPVAEGPNAIELAVLDWFRQWVGMPTGTAELIPVPPDHRVEVAHLHDHDHDLIHAHGTPPYDRRTARSPRWRS